MSYAVTLTPAVEKAVARLPKRLRERIADRLLSLSNNPRGPGSVKLTGQDGYRVRIGEYRIIYTIFDKHLVILVIDVGHRRDVYRRK